MANFRELNTLLAKYGCKMRIYPESCGARTRAGSPCKLAPVKGKKRCRLHGGLSTGPKTPEGKARSLAALQEGNRRWCARK